MLKKVKTGVSNAETGKTRDKETGRLGGLIAIGQLGLFLIVKRADIVRANSTKTVGRTRKDPAGVLMLTKERPLSR